MLKNETSLATPNIMFAVVSFCFITPLTFVHRLRFCGSLMMVVETSAGPHGACDYLVLTLSGVYLYRIREDLPIRLRLCPWRTEAEAGREKRRIY
jgi:hypothetical protein